MLYNRFIKNTLQTITCFSVMFLAIFTSCEDQTVNLSPIDKITDPTAFSTAERCELAVVGVYDAAQSGYYNGGTTRRGYPFGAASIIQSEMRGEDMALTAVFYDYTFSATHDPTTGNNVAMWENSFACINRANVVIEGITAASGSGIITEAEADQHIGECLFIRALTYHNLMIHFALPYGVEGNNNYGLPYYEKAHNTPDRISEGLLIGRSTVNETYTKILADLNKAEELLPDVHAINKLTRASKGAAIAIKTRVYLHMKDWKSVIAESKKLVSETVAPFSSPLANYKLTSTPSEPFVSFTANSESIFSIENSKDDNASVNGSMAQMMSNRKGGRGIITSSPILYNTKFWTATDKRRNLLFYTASNKTYYCDKFQRPEEQDEYAPIIRYAEVLLNYAEAEVRSNNTELALNLLNAVRDRSVEPADRYVKDKFKTSKDLLEAILWERRIEFMGEGRRWEDIHRLVVDADFPSKGIPAKIEYKNISGKGAFVINGSIPDSYYAKTGFVPYTDRRFLWPISLNDILRNPTLAKQQNAGW